MPSMVWNYLRVRGEYSFRGKNVVSGLELPPRARRIRRGPREENRNAGTTSAYAENTAVSSVAAMTARNYLRVRGEYSPNPDPVWLSAELPPRTRRILAHELGVTILMGTTSAYAENTADDVYVALHQRNYLRVRGEYDSFSSSAAFAWELPPRTRRIHDPGFAVGASPGTTSAYAENTLISKKAQVSVRNYLRVRGEYCRSPQPRPVVVELPPRTRRIRDKFRLSQTFNGTTSAYAENTISRAGILRTGGNYLRVRGEYWTALRAETLDGELPPRTRRIPLTSPPKMNSQGTTSAYAENTKLHRHWGFLKQNYLRVRGEYGNTKPLPHRKAELPPRTRRIL